MFKKLRLRDIQLIQALSVHLPFTLHFWIVIFLSVLMITFASLFSINTFLDHPQFDHLDYFTTLRDQSLNEKPIWFISFFIVDFVWAPLLLLLGARQIIKWFPEIRMNRAVYYVVSAVVAYLFDVVENSIYLTGLDIQHVSLVVAFKELSYFVVAIAFIYQFFKVYVFPNLRKLFLSIGSSIISLLLIGIVVALMTQMPQGGTIIVEMMFSPFNIVFSQFLIFFLAIIVSHYPLYLEQAINGHNDQRKWHMHGKTFFGLGLIYFSGSTSRPKRFLKYIRHALGIFMFLAYIYVILFAAFKYHQIQSSPLGICLVIGVLFVFLYLRFSKLRESWNAKEPEATLPGMKKVMKVFPYLIIAQQGLLILNGILAAVYDWAWVTIILSLLATIVSMSIFLIFRVGRSYLKYFFYNENLKSEIFENREEFLKIKDQFIMNQFRFLGLGYLSDNRIYLKFIRLIGFSLLGFLILVNLSIGLTTFINPLNIMFIYLIQYYGVIILMLKHFLFYNSLEDSEQQVAEGDENWSTVNKYRYFRYAIPMSVILLFGAAIYLNKIDNDLHDIQLVRNNPFEQIGFTEYLEEFKEKQIEEDKTLWFIGSYGGGLKANLWNMLLIEKLQKQTHNQFLENTAVVSGVSGGTMGIGDYYMIRANPDTNDDKVTSAIRNIGKYNFLSLDLTWLLGMDFFRKFFPQPLFHHQGKDRAWKAMQLYQDIAGVPDSLQDLSFREFYSSIRSRHQLPALIVNSTQTNGKQGIAFSLKDAPAGIFPGAVDVLDEIENKNKQDPKSISFASTLSLSNRFPIFSPAARINTLGHFVDGGYFDNSGLISAYNIGTFYKSDTANLRTPRYLNIINSRDQYIRFILKQWEFEITEASNSGETKAILNTVVSIDKIPGYISNRIASDGYEVYEIYMPHPFEYNDVVTSLGGEPKNPEKLMKLITKHNEIIDNTLNNHKPYKERWGIVVPPLARLLSEPAVEYQMAMVNYHPYVTKQINTVIALTK